MSLILGGVLGLGVLLVLSPWLWPARATATSRRRAFDSSRDALALAGLGGVSIPVVAIVCLLLALVGGALAQAVFHVPILTAVAAVLGAALVPMVVNARAVRRRAANREVWPDVVDHLVASVRAGMSLPDSVAALAELGPAVTRPAFAEFEADFGRSGNFGQCIDRLKSTLADPTADRILETLRMAREVGGSDVTAVLRGLAGYLREDAAVRSEVVARQSWIRNAARLGVAAPWLLLLVLASRQETLVAYDSTAGSVLIVVGVVVTFVAYRAMIALGRLPEERRWLR
ncbi:type II secretion system F family protein [Agromyces mariniharenae]|uniref:Type II secretion system F family protein n=1 Tax=Agromyces mariniharenae TaxID=2604423 RepID=A0A5S4UXS8_9MICO|nr:type II secretion system F family protein [Agromyces mariniharenae]TYL50509.1 type II secretion system F family protein [Agromyces mariniharenae]